MENIVKGPVTAVSADLLDYLEKVFPDRLPIGAYPSPSEIAALMGQQQVIQHLRKQAKAQGRALPEVIKQGIQL